MRITEIDLQCEDIMWFGVDTIGNIFECTSAGYGNVPEYVCRSREETNKLVDFFTQTLTKSTEYTLLIPRDDSQLIDDITELSSKGIYCYDMADHDNEEIYTRVSIPIKPINISELPQDIKDILADHFYNSDITNCSTISVKHAY